VPSVTWIDECPKRSMIALGCAPSGDEHAGVGVAQVVIAHVIGQTCPLHCWPAVGPVPVGVAHESTGLEGEHHCVLCRLHPSNEVALLVLSRRGSTDRLAVLIMPPESRRRGGWRLRGRRGDGHAVSERAVKPPAVVRALDVVEHGGPELGPGGTGTGVDQLPRAGSEDRLRDGVVPAFTGHPDREDDPVRPGKLVVVEACPGSRSLSGRSRPCRVGG